MSLIQKICDHAGPFILAPLFIVFFILESRFQLRRRVQAGWKRVGVNIAVSLPSFALLRLVFIPLMVGLAVKNQSLRLGINYWYPAAPWIKTVVALFVLDYGNYLWHQLNHKLKFLWRFHLVHHTDLDLDVTTAFRFHFGELIWSLVFRGVFTLLSGAAPVTILIYEICFEAATQFHHSNWRLPPGFERVLNLVFVTPRMHGIHHSRIKKETDSNYSVIFSFWDRIHKTIRLNVIQDDIVIGVPSYSNPKELSPGFLLKLPFTGIRPWKVKTGSAEKPEESAEKAPEI
jgi:sterol desaturase/sphingolipid hydroxylase (fatty acid hydroxylase superfamily)